MKDTQTIHAQALELVSKMSLKEKTSLLVGKNFWETNGVDRLNLFSQTLTDGPHGLRKQNGKSDHLGINDSIRATCFPTACASACSFDKDLLYQMGQALGEKCLAENVGTILGPGINIKRNPLCGRNFEYFSEDPYLSGKMAASLINGVQSCNVGTSLKHFAANNQENQRMTSNSVIDARALHEIYLKGFEIAIKEAAPWTVMCSYNKINGTYVNESKTILTDILRKAWGFSGAVISDWGAVSDKINGIKAGMDLEMPGTCPDDYKYVLDAVKNKKISEEEIDVCATRIVELLLKISNGKVGNKTFSEEDKEKQNQEHNLLAEKIAEQSAVLLKNDGILPLKKDKKILVVGKMAKTPRYQGSGSSKINPAYLDNAFLAIKSFCKDAEYAEDLEALNNVQLQDFDTVIIYSGLPDEYEQEGFDRDSMTMPESSNQLITQIASKNKNTVVVLECGSAIELPWLDKVSAVLLMYLGGQSVGKASSNLLFGKANPSGKLAETWPIKYKDVVNADNFPSKNRKALYCESIFVGYRYFDTANVPVQFPFGYGLSYTKFSYDSIDVRKIADFQYEIDVSISNIGTTLGSEVVELFIGKKESKIFRAKKELKGFSKLKLQAGETKKATFCLNKDDFSYFNSITNSFCIESGTYSIMIGSNSKDILLSKEITIEGDNQEKLLSELYQKTNIYFTPKDLQNFSMACQQFEVLLGQKTDYKLTKSSDKFTISSTVDDINDTFIGKAIEKKMKKNMEEILKNNTDPGMSRMLDAMLLHSPIRFLHLSGGLSIYKIEGIIDLANGHIFKGIKKMLK